MDSNLVNKCGLFQSPDDYHSQTTLPYPTLSNQEFLHPELPAVLLHNNRKNRKEPANIISLFRNIDPLKKDERKGRKERGKKPRYLIVKDVKTLRRSTPLKKRKSPAFQRTSSPASPPLPPLQERREISFHVFSSPVVFMF